MLTFEYGPIRFGGLAAMVTALCRAIDKRRFEPVVVLPRSGHSPAWQPVARRSLAGCEADLYREEGCEIWLLSNALLDRPIYPAPFQQVGIKKIDEYSERVAGLLGELAVDLIHLHDGFGYKCLYEARRLGLPSALTIHRLHEDLPGLAFAELAAARLVDDVTTVSRSYLQERQDFFRGCTRVHAIPNGLEPGFWSEAQLPPAPGGRPERLRGILSRLALPPGPTFAYVGRLDSVQKGLDTVLEALARHLPGAGLNLIIAGEGDPELAQRVSAAAQAAPSGKVRFLQRMLAPEEVRELLGAVDFVVIPSRFEPFGLIQLEAMAMGALPVASAVGGLRDVLLELHQPEGFGRLFEPGDSGALAAAMREMMELARRPVELERARQAARARAQAYSARAMAERYEQLYTSMLERGASERVQRAG